MSCPNFEMQKDFPLFATSIFDGYYDEEEDEYFDGDYWLFEECEKKLEEFNNSLEFYSIALQSGYHSGVQVILEKPEGEYAPELTEDYTPEDWRENRKYDKCCYFRYAYSVQQRKEKAEIKKIIKYCREYLCDEYEFAEYGLCGQFSNGETVYKKVDAILKPVVNKI